MNGLGNVVFVVWRESVEALLVVGILNAWLAQQAEGTQVRRGRMFLWAGVLVGLLVAAVLGSAILFFDDWLSDDALDLFQTAMVLLAALLIVQMVVWMRRHAAGLKRELHQALQSAADRANWWGVFFLAAIAVAREGSETVVFLAGTLAAARQGPLAATIGAAGAGLAAAIVTYALLQAGRRILSWRVFFQFTEVVLLLLAASLLVSGADHLVGLDLLPRLSGRLWDTSGILPESGLVGGLLASLAGYRARPDLTQVLVYALYWGVMAWLLLRPFHMPRPR